MAKKTIYRTVLKVEILSDGYPHNLESLSLEEIGREIIDGDWSGATSTITFAQPIKGIRAVRAIQAQGSAPDFFQMDEKGNELEDY